jgi:hypothetical protein
MEPDMRDIVLIPRNAMEPAREAAWQEMRTTFHVGAMRAASRVDLSMRVRRLTRITGGWEEQPGEYEGAPGCAEFIADGSLLAIHALSGVST